MKNPAELIHRTLYLSLIMCDHTELTSLHRTTNESVEGYIICPAMAVVALRNAEEALSDGQLGMIQKGSFQLSAINIRQDEERR